jgi:serine/threonine protein phosphatase PrpC
MYKIEYKFIDYGGSTDKAQMHKIEHDAAYALLYKMLERYHGITNPAFDRNENGKPFLVGYDVHFSISHTEGLVTCAISDKPIGVDAEKISAKVEAGDIIIMFSDGICDGTDDAPWLVELLNRSGGGDLKGLAEAILAAAKEHAAYKDDMTVVVSKVGSV